MYGMRKCSTGKITDFRLMMKYNLSIISDLEISSLIIHQLSDVWLQFEGSFVNCSFVNVPTAVPEEASCQPEWKIDACLKATESAIVLAWNERAFGAPRHAGFCYNGHLGQIWTLKLDFEHIQNTVRYTSTVNNLYNACHNSDCLFILAHIMECTHAFLLCTLSVQPELFFYFK